jgi:xanthine dehydrogenase accessory factor
MLATECQELAALDLKRIHLAYVNADKKNLPCAIAKITARSGSTYRHEGAMMLVDKGGGSCGMLSGGCFENEVISLAQKVIASQAKLNATFDFASLGDAIFGFGLGCNGTICVEVRPLPRGLDDKGRDQEFGAIAEIPHLVVFGAGDDVIPVHNMAHELGLSVTIIDHRPKLLTHDRFPQGNLVLNRPEAIDRREFGQETFVVCMTHNLLLDAAVIETLGACNLRYFGVLGNKARLDKLRELIAQDAIPGMFWDKVSCPVGSLDLPTHSPQAIALSLVTELYTIISNKEAFHERRTDRHRAASSWRIKAPRDSETADNL